MTTRGLRSSPPSSSRKDEGSLESFVSSIEWSAELVQPQGRINHDSSQAVAVKVSAPIRLDGQPVTFLVGGVRLEAQWLGEAGHSRTAVATLQADQLQAGSSNILHVKVRAGSEEPSLRAGRIRVRSS